MPKFMKRTHRITRDLYKKVKKLAKSAGGESAVIRELIARPPTEGRRTSGIQADRV